MIKHFFKSTGQYLGFVFNDYIFSRDGVYLGWLENNGLVWGADGQFRGVLIQRDGNYYVWRNQYTASPLPKSPRATPVAPSLPPPVSNINAFALPLGYHDSF
jgi:hypothetical protein